MVQSFLFIVATFLIGCILTYFFTKKKNTHTDFTTLPEFKSLTLTIEELKTDKTKVETTAQQTLSELLQLKATTEQLTEKQLLLTAQNATLTTEKSALSQQKEELLILKEQQVQTINQINKRSEELHLNVEKLKIEHSNTVDKNNQVTQEVEQLKTEKQKLYADKLELERTAGELSSKNTVLQEQLQEQRQEFIAIQEKAKLEIKEMVQNIVEEKTKSFDQNSKDLMEAVLTPLKDNLIAFKKTVDETHISESKERAIIQERIRDLVEKTNEVSKQADNLTTALKGQTKTQGDWGEMILESILQKSGLVRDREYTIQENIKSEEGKNQRPDVLIKLPDNRVIIVDSKVSLNAYERYVSAHTVEEQQQELKNHVLAIKNHINQLSNKQYDNIAESLDFTMMFLPIEPAYMLAIQYEADLWSYAYEKRILLVSPTNFMACVKLFADLWKRENQNQNAIDIATKAGALYDKFVGFVEDLDKVTSHLDKASAAHADAVKKLSTGGGNIVRRVEALKTLGIQANKSIQAKFTELNME